MCASARKGRGFTLIELIASITIIAIVAAVTLPRVTAATSFSERGYADGIAASLRQARAVAFASDCAVEFTINATGYRAMQRAVSGTHCAANGLFTTPVQRGDGGNLELNQPAGVTLAANRQFVIAPDGTVAGGPYSIGIGVLTVTISGTGVVSGP